MIELAITLVVGGLLMGAAFTILSSQIALYTVQGAKLETQVSLRTGAGMLSWALQELSATGGDLTTLGTNNVTIRAVHAAGIICSTGPIWIGVYGVSGQFAPQDSVLTYAIEDDEWNIVRVNNVDTLPATVAANTPDCFWGDTTNAPNPEVAIELVGSATIIDNLKVGAPIRAFHPVAYNLEVVDGRYWLVQRVSEATNPELLARNLSTTMGHSTGLIRDYALDTSGVGCYYDCMESLTPFLTTPSAISDSSLSSAFLTRFPKINSNASASGRVDDVLRQLPPLLLRILRHHGPH